MADYRTPRPGHGAIPLFSREANRLLGRGCVEANSCPWAGEEAPQGSTSPEGDQGARGEGSYGQGDPSCLTCLVSFGSREEQVEHYQLDWHRYNIKRRLRGLEGVDQAHFEGMEGDLSSISGSESDSDDELKTTERDDDHGALQGKGADRSPYLHFSSEEGSTHSIYRCIIPGSQSNMEPGHDLGHALQALREPQMWIILMRSGGHFAGAVFKGGSVVAHKTFHRYTVRAKRGTAQSVRDGQQGGHQPKSAGASLRRYNEAALMAEMRDLMTSWSAYTDEASCIFIRVPKHSKGILVGDRGDKAPFLRGDHRLRDLPFPTRRPTFREVQSAHARLATIYVGVSEAKVSPHNRGEKDRKSAQSRKKEEKEEGKKEKGGRKVERGEGGEEEGKMEGRQVVGEGTRVEETEREGKEEEEGNEVVTEGSSDAQLEDPSAVNLDVPDAVSAGSQVQSEGAGKGKKRKKNKKKLPQASTPSDPAMPEFVQQLLLACEAGDQVTPAACDEVTELLRGLGLRVIDEVRMEGSNGGEVLDHLSTLWNGTTVLHVAATKGCFSLVPILLLYGVNPATKDQSGHTPYLVAKTKEVRDSFRRFMSQHPAAYDYECSHIPSPLTEEMEKDRSKKEAEKKREKKKAKKQREKEKQCELTQQQAVATLSDREKRAMAAEKRMATKVPRSPYITQMGACSGCSRSLVGVVPFERLDFKYCSMECLRQHRKQLTS